MNDVGGSLAARIQRLSPAQRAWLWERVAHRDAHTAERAGAARLVAYVVPVEPGAPPDAAELREFLRARLPEHMVPSAFVLLERLPRMPNGKVDLSALPQADDVRVDPDAGLIGPRTEAERVLARIWAEVLDTDRIGIHDNFFELGGDSILSIRVVARAQQAGLALTPDQLFRHQSLAALAAAALTAAPLADEAQSTTRAHDSGRNVDADFPEAGLTADELDRFLGGLLP